MLAVDTNVLIRLLVDDPREAEEVAVARKAVQGAERVLIPDVVLVETIWVLKGKKYGFKKQQILECFAQLLENERYAWSNWDEVSQALGIYLSYDVDFADCLILVKAERADALLLTFDRDLGAIQGARLLSTAV